MYYNDSPPCMTAYIAKSQTSYNLRNSIKLWWDRLQMLNVNFSQAVESLE